MTRHLSTTDRGRHPSVDLVLPCLDEAEALPGLLALVPPGWGVVVVDNGSRDGTADVARAAGARVVAEPRRGYGAAVHAGVVAATADVVAVLDGDGSVRPADLRVLVDDVAAGRADLACGARRPVPGAWAWHARLGNRVLARVVARRTGLRLHDIAPVRVARRSALLELDVRDRRCGYPLETLLRAAEAGWRVTEHPVTYHPRGGGRSKVSGSVRGTVRVARDFAAVLAR